MTAIGNLYLWLAEIYKIITSETTGPNNLLDGVNDVCEILHSDTSFHLNPAKIWPPWSLHVFDWLNIKKSSL